jgi:hypothetical protein
MQGIELAPRDSIWIHNVRRAEGLSCKHRLEMIWRKKTVLILAVERSRIKCALGITL